MSGLEFIGNAGNMLFVNTHSGLACTGKLKILPPIEVE
jgi:hypothetical protein